MMKSINSRLGRLISLPFTALELLFLILALISGLISDFFSGSSGLSKTIQQLKRLLGK